MLDDDFERSCLRKLTSGFYFLVEHLWDLQTELPGRQLNTDRLESRMASLNPSGWIRSSSVPMA